METALEMKVVPVSEWRKLVGEELKEALPAILTHNGGIFAVIAAPEDVIILSDLHPRLRIQFRALEQRARKGMPAPRKIYKSTELIEPGTRTIGA